MQKGKYGAGDDDGKKRGNKYSLVYGLCKEAGIDTTGMTPRQAWEALEKATGKTKAQIEREHWEKVKKREDEKREVLARKVEGREEKTITDAAQHEGKYAEKRVRYNAAGSKDVSKVDICCEYQMSNHGSAPIKSVPNSMMRVIKNGKIEQERYFNEKGDVYLDIDYSSHGNHKKHPIVPHQHRWEKDEEGNLIRGEWEVIRK